MVPDRCRGKDPLSAVRATGDHDPGPGFSPDLVLMPHIRMSPGNRKLMGTIESEFILHDPKGSSRYFTHEGLFEDAFIDLLDAIRDIVRFEELDIRGDVDLIFPSTPHDGDPLRSSEIQNRRTY